MCVCVCVCVCTACVFLLGSILDEIGHVLFLK